MVKPWRLRVRMGPTMGKQCQASRIGSRRAGARSRARGDRVGQDGRVQIVILSRVPAERALTDLLIRKEILRSLRSLRMTPSLRSLRMTFCILLQDAAR